MHIVICRSSVWLFAHSILNCLYCWMPILFDLSRSISLFDLIITASICLFSKNLINLFSS